MYAFVFQRCEESPVTDRNEKLPEICVPDEVLKTRRRLDDLEKELTRSVEEEDFDRACIFSVVRVH